jgi:hypothetical protein
VKTYWGVEVELHALLTSALDGCEWSASRPGHYTPREKASDTHWIGGGVDPRAGLDAVVERKIPNPRRESNPRTPIIHPVAQSYTDFTFLCSDGKFYLLQFLYESCLVIDSTKLSTQEQCFNIHPTCRVWLVVIYSSFS